MTALLLAAGSPVWAATASASGAQATQNAAPVNAVVVATPVAAKTDAQHGGEYIQFSAGNCKYSGRARVAVGEAPSAGFLDKLMALGRGGSAQHWEGDVQLATCAVPGAGLNTTLVAYSFETVSVNAGEQVTLQPLKEPALKSHHRPPVSAVPSGQVKTPSGFVPLPPAEAAEQEKVRSAADAASAAAVFEAAKARAALMASGTKVVHSPEVIPGVHPTMPTALPASAVAVLAGVPGATLPNMAKPATGAQAPAAPGTVVNAAGMSRKASLAAFASAAQARAAQSSASATSASPAGASVASAVAAP
jgi:hypothetical protein